LTAMGGVAMGGADAARRCRGGSRLIQRSRGGNGALVPAERRALTAAVEEAMGKEAWVAQEMVEVWAEDRHFAKGLMAAGATQVRAWERVGGSEGEAGRLWQCLAALGAPLYRARFALPGPSHWRALWVVDEAPASHFDALRDTALSLAPWAPMAVVARTGRGFHGRFGRAWQAAPGNLHLCAVAPVQVAAAAAASAPMLGVVATQEGLERVAQGAWRARIKWINDVLVDGAKVAGTLTAAQVHGEGMGRLLFGIGVNVAHAPLVPRSRCVPRVGSLAQVGEVSLGAVLWEILASLGRWMAVWAEGGGVRLHAAYVAATEVIGQRVVLWPDAAGGPEEPRVPLASGVLEAILPDLSLRISGHVRPFGQGRLMVLDDGSG